VPVQAGIKVVPRCFRPLLDESIFFYIKNVTNDIFGGKNE